MTYDPRWTSSLAERTKSIWNNQGRAVSLTNAVAFTTIVGAGVGDVVIPADSLQAGSVLRVRAGGLITPSGAATSFDIIVSLNGGAKSSVTTTVTKALFGGVSALFAMNCDLAIKAGAPPEIYGPMNLLLSDTTGAYRETYLRSGSGVFTMPALNVAITVDVAIVVGTGTARIDQLSIEQIR